MYWFYIVTLLFSSQEKLFCHIYANVNVIESLVFNFLVKRCNMLMYCVYQSCHGWWLRTQIFSHTIPAKEPSIIVNVYPSVQNILFWGGGAWGWFSLGKKLILYTSNSLTLFFFFFFIHFMPNYIFKNIALSTEGWGGSEKVCFVHSVKC